MKRIAIVLLVGIFLFSFRQFSDPNRYFEITKNIELFTNIYKELNYYYVDDIEPGKLMKVGIDAMLNSLDPYTNYFSEAQVESYRVLTEGKYHGIGAGIRMIDGLPTVTELFEESPANKSGIQLGDQITSVGGKSLAGKTKEEVNTFLQGAADSKLDVIIKRPGESKLLNYSITRGEVDVPNVPYSGMVGDKTGYINLTVFSEAASSHVAAALRALQKDHPEMNGLILDLRDNPGGLLREAVNICNVFIPKNELVVTTKGKVKEWDRAFKTTQSAVDDKIPITVLIDKGSASASEIVSGVLQDLDRAVILGQLSYGKGLVQNTREIGYNSQVKLTTAKYYIPSGRCIQAVEYENGEPKHIPDSLRAEFKTKSGRKVLDGGGIKPDITIDPEKLPEILSQLTTQEIIFKYATAYKLKHKEIKPLREYKFTEFDEFKKFVSESGFKYVSPSTLVVQQLKEKAKSQDNWASVSKEIESISDKLKEDQGVLLQKYQNQIMLAVEKEIIPRYYLQKGKIEKSLQIDTEIQEAVKILSDQSKYQAILKG